jgi:Transglutaminase-like superfamily
MSVVIPSEHYTYKIPDGDPGADFTLREMSSATRRYPLVCRPWVESLTAATIAGSANDEQAMAKIYTAVNGMIQYRPDPPDLELVKSPCRIKKELDTYGKAYEDCDGISVMIAAMLQMAGIPAGFMAVSNGKASENAPLDHVYACGYDRQNNAWTPLDPVAPGKNWSGHRFMFYAIPRHNFLDTVITFFMDIFATPAKPVPELIL